MDYPFQRLHGPVISSQSRESVGLSTRSQTASAAWVSANRAIYIPFQINVPFPMTKLFWANGATASGNTDCGIYSEDGAKIISTGSTAQAGTNIIQSVSAAMLLTPGWYYMALVMNGVTGTVMRGTPGLYACINSGMAQQATAFALPATFTLATVTSSYVPVFGLTSATVI